MKKPKKKNLTIRAMAEHFGVSHSYIAGLKDKGMPMDSTEAAEAWRNERQQRVGTRTKNLPDPEPPADAPEIPPAPPIEEEPEEPEHAELLGIEMTGLEQELKTARAMAKSAGRRVKEAERNPKFEAVIGQRQQTYNKAVENYERMEKSVRRERQARAELMTVDQHKVQLNRLWVPAITLMRKMPRTLAVKICPGDDVAAEKILAEGVEEVITEMRRSLKDEEPNGEWHLQIWLACMLRDDPTSALKKLEELTKQVTDVITSNT